MKFAPSDGPGGNDADRHFAGRRFCNLSAATEKAICTRCSTSLSVCRVPGGAALDIGAFPSFDDARTLYLPQAQSNVVFATFSDISTTTVSRPRTLRATGSRIVPIPRFLCRQIIL